MINSRRRSLWFYMRRKQEKLTNISKYNEAVSIEDLREEQLQREFAFQQSFTRPVEAYYQRYQLEECLPSLSKDLEAFFANSDPRLSFFYLDQIEKEYILEKIERVYTDPDMPDEYRQYFENMSTKAKVCEELLAQGESLPSKYPELDNKGYFEWDYDTLRLWEQIRFGKIVSTLFEGPYEVNTYEIQVDKAYREYRMKLYEETIRRICKRIPEYIFFRLPEEDKEAVCFSKRN